LVKFEQRREAEKGTKARNKKMQQRKEDQAELERLQLKLKEEK
jgi:hypothetical protein